MSIFASIQFQLSSLTPFVFRVTFFQSVQLWEKFQIFKSDQCPEIHRQITFLQPTVENVKYSALLLTNFAEL
jgi:hypothetical protein